MKPTVKILLFCFVLALISGCCSQKCAERRIQRIVKNHPELIDVKLRTLDTLITVEGYTDRTALSMADLTQGKTYYETTDHGTFVVHVASDDSVCIDFVADSQQIRYQDTVKYRQITIHGSGTSEKRDIGFWHRITEWISFLAIGMGVAFWLLWKFFKNNKTKIL